MTTPIRVLELCVLGFATWPGVRLAASGSLRRQFPAVYAGALLALVLWGCGVALVAVMAPTGLHVLAALIAAALAVATVRARTGFRFARRLPPGSLSLVESIRALADRRFYLDKARRHGPIFKTAQFNHKVVCVLGLERGHGLLRDHAASLEPTPQPFTREISGGFLRYMEGDTYRLYGPLFRKALARPVMAAAGQVTLEVTRRELDRAAADCVRSPHGGVRPALYLERVVHGAFLRALFGITPGSVEEDRVADPFRQLARQSLGAPLEASTKDALGLLREELAGHLARQLDGSPVTATSALTELNRIDARMPDETCYDNLLFTHKVATANVASLLHWLLAILGRHPSWLARGRAELDSPGPSDGPPLSERLVLETLRLAQSEYLYRQIARDIEYEGFRLPAGWMLRICVWESHRDADIFEDPESFNPDRFLANAFTPAEYSPFGWSGHACNGVPLAMLISRTFVEELVRRFELTVSHAEPVERDFRHWSHWRPSSRLELRLAPQGTGT
ncbi:MAG: cytochrome P450 [Actinomycetota bacterium]|nr:cytochrome P450 [Actinomycetota bacterium]